MSLLHPNVTNCPWVAASAKLCPGPATARGETCRWKNALGLKSGVAICSTQVSLDGRPPGAIPLNPESCVCRLHLNWLIWLTMNIWCIGRIRLWLIVHFESFIWNYFNHVQVPSSPKGLCDDCCKSQGAKPCSMRTTIRRPKWNLGLRKAMY